MSTLWLTGCVDSCEELQRVCDQCQDPNQKAACEHAVDLDDGERCDLDLSNYCAACGRRGTTVIEACR